MAKETLAQSSRYSLFLCRPGARLDSCRRNRNAHVHLCLHNIILVEAGILNSTEQLQKVINRRKLDRATTLFLLKSFKTISTNF